MTNETIYKEMCFACGAPIKISNGKKGKRYNCQGDCPVIAYSFDKHHPARIHSVAYDAGTTKVITLHERRTKGLLYAKSRAHGSVRESPLG